MEVNSINASSSPAQTSKKSTTVDYNAFLQLLVAQMKNQDPTNPTDGTQFLSQLASFSAVEQGVQTNSKLDALITNSLFNQSASLIGRTATSADGSVSGRISSVSISGHSLIAGLENGASIAMTDQVVVS